MTAARILVIDDEKPIHRFLGPALEANGYEPLSALTGADGLAQLKHRPPDAVILDLGLPDMEGLAVLAAARETYPGPILILSARDRETEKIAALDGGADDYVEKPFGIGELMARLRAALRNRLVREGAEPVVQAGGLEIDLVRRTVKRDGERMHLSRREYDLLAALVRAGGRVVTQRQLLTQVWGPANVDDVQYLRTYVGHLRTKLEPEPAMPRYIVTEAGVGYRFVAADEA